MKLTKNQLKAIIKEEINQVLSEVEDPIRRLASTSLSDMGPENPSDANNIVVHTSFSPDGALRQLGDVLNITQTSPSNAAAIADRIIASEDWRLDGGIGGRKSVEMSPEKALPYLIKMFVSALEREVGSEKNYLRASARKNIMSI